VGDGQVNESREAAISEERLAKIDYTNHLTTSLPIQPGSNYETYCDVFADYVGCASWLDSVETPIAVQQKLMRHASITTMMDHLRGCSHGSNGLRDLESGKIGD
jgi:hypothetical protein